MPRAVCILNKDLRRFKLPLLINLEALHKQEVKAKAKLQSACLSIEVVSQKTHTALQQRLGDLLVWGSGTGSIINQTNQAETSVTPYNKEYILHRITSQKSQNKQQRIKIANPGERGESDLQSYHIIAFKFPRF